MIRYPIYKDDKIIDSIHEIGKKLGDKKITVKIFKNNNFREKSINIRSYLHQL